METRLWRKIRQGVLVVLLIGLFFQASLPPAAQAATQSPSASASALSPSQASSIASASIGDLVVAAYSGSFEIVDPQTGAVLQTLNTQGDNFQSGMCLDGLSSLYVTKYSLGLVSQFDGAGNLLKANFISGLSAPLSCTVDPTHHTLYVGTNTVNSSGGLTYGQLYQYDVGGNLLATFQPDIDTNGGIFSMALGIDGCTLYYTDGFPSVKVFNVCTGQQLPDLASLRPNFQCFDLRRLTNGQFLVACSGTTSQVYLLNADGSIGNTYAASTYGAQAFDWLAVDPSGASFWTAAPSLSSPDNIYQINLGTGNLLGSVQTNVDIAGLAIFGAAGSTNPANRPIIFLHGINQNANESGVPNTTNPTNNQFVPLFDKLNPVYGGPFFQTFKYVDDRALTSAPGGCPANLFPPCQSQSAILDNAELLEKLINKLYTQTNHRVTLIGYSMGAAIIRTALAGCPDGLGNFKCADAPNMVDNVFFLNGVQQGSWLLRVKQGVDAAGALPGEYGQIANIMAQFLYNLIQIKMGLNANYPAEGDLTPGSTNINAHNSVPAPAGLHYFNFYGDIQLQLVAHIGPFLESVMHFF